MQSEFGQGNLGHFRVGFCGWAESRVWHRRNLVRYCGKIKIVDRAKGIYALKTPETASHIGHMWIVLGPLHADLW